MITKTTNPENINQVSLFTFQLTLVTMHTHTYRGIKCKKSNTNNNNNTICEQTKKLKHLIYHENDQKEIDMTIVAEWAHTKLEFN